MLNELDLATMIQYQNQFRLARMLDELDRLNEQLARFNADVQTIYRDSQKQTELLQRATK